MHENVMSQLPNNLSTVWLGRKIEYFEEIGSTNDYAKSVSEKAVEHGLVVIADRQTQGKGSRGRQWISPPNSGIWMSIVLKPGFGLLQAREISLLTSYSIVKTLREKYALPVKIKWPNDLVYNQRKVAGILTEPSADGDSLKYIVIGIGINVNGKEFPDEIKEVAASLMSESGREFSRAQLIADILYRMEKDYEDYLGICSLKEIKNEYSRLLVHAGKKVQIIRGSFKKEAIAMGINENGELNVQYADGKKESIGNGEVSVRGMYSYA